MRIAFILPSLANTGPIILVRNLLNHIYNKVESIDVFFFKDIVELEFPVESHRIKLSSKIDFNKYDIIHSHMIKPDYYVWKNRKRIRGKCISTLHQFIYPSLIADYNIITAKIVTPFWYKFLCRHDAVVSISESLKQYFEARVQTSRSSVIYNGIEIIKDDHKINYQDDKKILDLKSKYRLVGNFSEFTRSKGVEQLIKSLTVNKEIALLLIGRGKSVQELQRLAKKLKVEDRCLFLGHKKDILSYYKYLDVYTTPSRSEGFGLSMVEAVSQSVPVVCSDIPVFRELFTEAEVTYFKLNNIDALSDALDFAFNNSDKLTNQAYLKFEANYTADRMANEYLETYKNLLHKT